MTIRRRLIIAFISVLALLLGFAYFQTWVYNRIADVNVNMIQINRMTEQIEEIRRAQETYLDLNARRYIGIIETSLQALKSETGLLQKERLKSGNEKLVEEVSDFYVSYEKGLKSFISTNDQYHALVENREIKIKELNDVLINKPPNAPQEVLILAVDFLSRKHTLTPADDPSLTQLARIGKSLMAAETPFEMQIFGRRLSVLSAEILELIDSVDQINLKNQALLYSIDQELKGLYERLTRIRLSEQAYSNQLIKNLQIIYLSVMVVSLVVVILLVFRLSRRIGTGVNVLMESTERIAGGDYGETVQLPGNDELSWLANNVNKMAEALRMSNLSIKTYSNQLEHLVKVKTYELTKANARLGELNDILASEKEKFAKLALTDILTGINNRAYFMEALTQKIDESKRYGKNFSLCLLDIDFFKNVNDQYGHLAGDTVLKQFSRLLKREVRTSDIVARYGGEEFIIIFTEATLVSAMQICERIRIAVMSETFDIEGLKITISGGVVAYHGETEAMLLKRVDDLLYLAKREGRNRLVSG